MGPGLPARFAAFALQDVVDEGVRRAYLNPDNKLRASVLADPAFTRRNTRDNTPSILHVTMVPGRKLSRSMSPRKAVAARPSPSSR